MAVNISATMKKDDRELNGLEHITKELIDGPLERRVVVGVIEVMRITRDVFDGGTETPTVRFVQLEALDGDAAETAKQLLAERYTGRTGASPEETLFDGGSLHEPDEPGE